MEQTIWKQLYLKLLGSVDDAVQVLPELPENEAVRAMLIRAIRDAEDLYIKSGDPEAGAEIG